MDPPRTAQSATDSKTKFVPAAGDYLANGDFMAPKPAPTLRAVCSQVVVLRCRSRIDASSGLFEGRGAGCVDVPHDVVDVKSPECSATELIARHPGKAERDCGSRAMVPDYLWLI